MRIWGKMLAVAIAPLMLGGCLWGPGKFTSNLTLKRAGEFVLDYKGEIVLQMPDKSDAPVPWDDKFATCFEDAPPAIVTDSSPVDDPVADEDKDPNRTCTPAEIAKLKSEYEKQQAERAESKRKENEEMAKLFGLPGSDDASSRRFAANLMQ